jgi:hypothetical protein
VRPHKFIALAILFATPAAAELYKWVDGRGGTHYSDRPPIELTAAAKVETVKNRVSVYSPDKALLQAVEAARLKKSQPEAPIESYRGPAPYAAPMHAPPLAAYQSCMLADCAIASGVQYPYPSNVVYPVHRRPPHLVQAVLPPGAIAGTINSNGAIPGNSASLNNVVPEKISPGPRLGRMTARPLREPPR